MSPGQKAAYDAHVRAVVDRAPPLSVEQVARLRLILRGGRELHREREGRHPAR